MLNLESKGGDVLHVELWDQNDYTDHEFLGSYVSVFFVQLRECI